MVDSFKKLKIREKVSNYTLFKNIRKLSSTAYIILIICIIKKDLEVGKKQDKVN